jgi:hypothetical protein
MNLLHSSHPRPSRVFFRLAIGPAILGLTFAADGSSPTDASAAPKTHVLFMGADIAVEKDKKFYLVQDVTPTKLMIDLDGKPVGVLQTGDVNLEIKEALKIASANIVVENLFSERDYAPGSDPFTQIIQGTALAAGETAVADLAQGELLRADMMVSGAHLSGNAGAIAAAEAQQGAAMDNLIRAHNTPISQTADVSSRAADSGARTSQHLYDAIRLTFEVTSDRNLSLPYFVVIAQISEPGSKPGHVRKWAYVKTLGELRAGEREKVTVFQGGMPPGYTIESTEVHLYDRGQELATNLSRKRVELTDEEALDYQVIEYVGVNKGRTLPASPITVTLSAAARESLTPAQLEEKCFVRVAKDGRVTATFRDAAGKQPIQDPALELVLKRLRFNPALEAGKPVESIVATSLSGYAPS